MDKSMSKEDAILWIKNIINDIESPKHLDLWGYEEVLYEIQKLLKEDSAQQWIPCSERLPEDDETVLVTRDNGIIEKATFEVGEVNNGWWMDFWYSEDNVKAWMPLPSPYKGEDGYCSYGEKENRWMKSN